MPIPHPTTTHTAPFLPTHPKHVLDANLRSMLSDMRALKHINLAHNYPLTAPDTSTPTPRQEAQVNDAEVVEGGEEGEDGEAEPATASPDGEVLDRPGSSHGAVNNDMEQQANEASGDAAADDVAMDERPERASEEEDGEERVEWWMGYSSKRIPLDLVRGNKWANQQRR